MTAPKELSLTALVSVESPESAEDWLWLLTITHPDFVEPIRLARNWRSIASRGNHYQPFPFAPSIAQEEPDRTPRLSIQIGNISRVVTAKLEEVQGSDDQPKVTLEVVLASQPSVVEFVLADFEFRNVTYGEVVLQADLEAEDFMSTPYPDIRRTPQIAPGSHRRTG